MAQISGLWKEALAEEFKKDYYKRLYEFVVDEYSKYLIYPDSEDIFNALHLTPLERGKVVILGQDPYHGEGQAHGLAFSVRKGIAIPKSLRNIYMELKDDLGIEPASHGCLEKWAKQGVLLLNTILTVRAGSPASHQDKGWEEFSDAIISILNKRENLVFMLWGKYAQSKAEMLDVSRHLVLKASHPSPLSAHRGFFSCRHFSKANDYLISKGLAPIDWKIED